MKEIFICSKDTTTLQRSIEFWKTSTPVDLFVITYWILLFVFLLVVCIWLLSNKKSLRLFKSISNNLLIISIFIWLLGFLVYLIGFYNLKLNWLSIIPRSIISSFKMFVVANDLARVSKVLQEDAIYMSVFSIVHFVAAFITFLFIFKLIGYKIKSSLNIIFYKWFKSKGDVVHIFWGINEASCLLAESIRKNYNHATETIIFINIDEKNEDNLQKKTTLSSITNIITIKNSEIVRLDAINALVDHCYNHPATLNGINDIFGTLHLSNIATIVQNSNQSYFYFLSDNEVKNLSGALNLQKDCKLCSIKNNKPIIYIHARKNVNNEVFDHYSQYDSETQRMKIKIVDSAYLSVATLKRDDRTLPVNCVKIDKMTGSVDSPFTALVVGFGATGQEAFKFLYEFSAFIGSDMKKSPFKCYAIDEKMNKMAGLIKEKMPAISDDELVLIQSSVDSIEFWKQIKKIISELNYVVIALNNDTIGLSFAVNLFKIALQCRNSGLPMLKIMVRCYESYNEKRMTEVIYNLNKSIEGNNVEVRLFGEERQLYRYDMILSDIILSEAKEYNCVYENSKLPIDEQWQKNFGEDEIKRLIIEKKMSRYHAIYDINRRITQNISNALHSRTKMILMGFGSPELTERLKLYYGYINSRKDGSVDYKCSDNDVKLLRNMAIVEHERWIASHKLMGYTYNSDNDWIKKHHKYICPWEDLEEVVQSYDCNVVDTTIKLEYKLRS